MPATNYYLQFIDRFLRPAIVQLGGTLPQQKMIENYEEYTLRCLALIASLLSAPGGGGGTVPADNSVTTLKILDGAITSAKIQDGSIATGDIADGAITTDKIADGSIGTVDIANLAITTSKIADGAIDSSKILDGSIATADLGTGVVTTAKILDGNVTTAKIADSAITSIKIADGAVVTVDLADGAVTSAKILDGTIATIDIADGAITAAKLAVGAVSTASIPDSGITTIKIVDGAVDVNKLATNAVSTTKIVDGAVTTNKIAADAITSAKIQDGTIATADIADGAITAAKLSSTAAVLSFNTLKGDLLMVPGSNVAINTVGQTFTINASNAVSSLTAPTNPYPGQVWFNIAGTTVSGIPSGNHGVWNSVTPAWVNVGSAQPGGAVNTATSAPSSATPGQTWFNISGSTLSTIPSGSHGVWNGSSWVNVGTAAPSTVTSQGLLTGFMASNSGALTTSVGAAIYYQMIFNTKVFDTFAAYNTATGAYTVTGQTGNWLWDVGVSAPWATSANASNVYVTKNSTSPVYADGVAINAYYIAVGNRPLVLTNGDVLRWYFESPVSPQSLNAGGYIHATRQFRVS